MGLSEMYNAPVPEDVGISIIKEAFNQGITFFDTADIYGPYTNEVLAGKFSAKKLLCLPLIHHEVIDISTCMVLPLH
jgi:aryl-alcohol dehydrogenase-like predicted oxidoreductase